MRACLLLLTAAAITGAGCKKETSAFSEQVATATPDTICAGNNWENVSPYPTHGLALVCKSKFYAPDKITNTVYQFDETIWTSLSSNVPLYMSGEFNTNFNDIVVFSIRNRGYVLDPVHPERGFWEYNYIMNTWSRRADFPGSPRDVPAYFTVGSKAYIVSGSWFAAGNPYLTDVWEYDAAGNTWTQKNNLSYPGRFGATGFAIGDKGYIIGGRLQSPPSPHLTGQLLQYDALNDSWTSKAVFPGEARETISSFVLNGKAYAGGGDAADGATVFQDFYTYNPAIDGWSRIADLPGVYSFFGIATGTTGFCIAADGGNNYMYKYNPQVCSAGTKTK